MARFAKGSRAAKAYMAKIRAMAGSGKRKKNARKSKTHGFSLEATRPQFAGVVPTLKPGARIRILATDEKGHCISGSWIVLAVGRGHVLAGNQDGTVLKVPTKGIALDNPSDVSADAAVREYEKFHWGDSPESIDEVDRPEAQGHLVAIGDLESVVYKTKKGGERARWEHKFGQRGKNRPVLAYDENDRLFLVGGGYGISERGIVK